MLILFFWITVLIIFYAYIGYTLLLRFFVLFKKKPHNLELTTVQLPEVTLLIAAYNEKDIIDRKIKNSGELYYPKEKLRQVWVTDGSTDGSNELLQQTKDITVLHVPERNGKTSAVNRAMETIKTPFTVLCDANTILAPQSVYKLISAFNSPEVGCVAGEKRIVSRLKDKATAAGEGFYWNYESLIKKLEASFGSTLGAAGELYAIRTNLYSPPPDNTILDDFVVSLSIADRGFKINYQPGAYAVEESSFNIAEEMKRKIRIAAGSFQVLFGMPSLLNFKKHFSLSYQYLSHKVLRWLIVPFSFPLAFFLNLALVFKHQSPRIYIILLVFQLIFYFFALLGSFLKEKSIRIKILFYPFYLLMMNYCIVLGLIRYLRKNQNAAWEKAKRR
ncbi:MAG: glycosyltransferase family 2 protein [Bacteroidales bacterium]|nr:glycosyltransferase family 2 protein [Bacteroidales bacterium]